MIAKIEFVVTEEQAPITLELKKDSGNNQTKLVHKATKTTVRNQRAYVYQVRMYIMQTAMVTSASFAYTIKCFHTQCWDLGGLGSRRSFTTRWRTASLSRVLGRGGAVETTTSSMQAPQQPWSFDGPGSTLPAPSALPWAPAPSMAMGRCAMSCSRPPSVRSEFGLVPRRNACPVRNKQSYKQGNPNKKKAG